jgi:superfamily II DNA or RNA helicase
VDKPGREWVKHDLKDDIDLREHSRRYRAILAPEEKWIESMLRETDKKLTEIRETRQADAAAWVRCMNINHAKAIRRVLTAITGEVPALLTSEEDMVREKRDAFKHGKQRWIVAVDMISEGTKFPGCGSAATPRSTASPSRTSCTRP